MGICAQCKDREADVGSYCHICWAEYMKKWRLKNKEKAKEIARKSASKYDKKFRKERPEEYNAKRRKYRSSQRNQENYRKRIEWMLSGTITRCELIEIFNRDKRCVYCGAQVTPRFSPYDPRGFDHVISRDKGGKHEKSNIVLCCRKCNEIKRELDAGTVEIGRDFNRGL